MIDLGFNYRLTDFQAALGLSQISRLDKFLKRRRLIARQYLTAFASIKEIILPPYNNLSDHAWHIFPIQFRTLSRDKIYSELLGQGIKCQAHYWPIHLQTYYKKTFGYKEGDFPLAEKYASRCLTIPLYPSMTDKMIKKVILAVQAAAKRGK
jgi:dTDP-4-amino-4,6-dideoxygalactose transaminase